MGSIFHAADKVLVWLGVGEGDYPPNMILWDGEPTSKWDAGKAGLIKAMHNTRPQWWSRYILIGKSLLII